MGHIRDMNETQLNSMRDRLKDMQADLRHEDSLGQEGQKTVPLDQQSVGRLSRMDALQQQAMAKATQARRSAIAVRIDAAFLRIDQGEFGYCAECGDDIPLKRLALDPTVPLCIGCASR